MAARKKVAAPSAFDVTHSLAKAKPVTCGDAHGVLVTLYGEAVADQFSSKGCRRLPRHEVTEAKGHKADKPLGLMKPAERSRAIASRAASKPGKAARPAKPVTRTIGGQRYTQVTKTDGSIVLTPVATEAPVAAPKAARPRRRTLKPVPAERQVAAPAKRSRVTKSRTSGSPKVARPAVG